MYFFCLGNYGEALQPRKFIKITQMPNQNSTCRSMRGTRGSARILLKLSAASHSTCRTYEDCTAFVPNPRRAASLRQIPISRTRD